jgi:fatty acid amide hydrolase 2
LDVISSGSDIAGSIRVPSHFVGIFGHKPTSGVISTEGHFPNSTDKNFIKYLTLGPMTRYSKDLPTLTHIMSSETHRAQLRLDQPIHTKDIDIFYLTAASTYSLSLLNVDELIQRRMLDACAHFKANGVHVQHLNESVDGDDAEFVDMSETLEISICTFFSIEDIPDLLSNDGTSVSDLLSEI